MILSQIMASGAMPPLTRVLLFAAIPVLTEIWIVALGLSAGVALMLALRLIPGAA